GEPIFHHFGVEAEIETLFDSRIELKSGISIVIEQTEALVAIDVNSGKFKTESDLEETAYLTNMEAVPEIVRQIRLRDLGGMLVIDFIDMMEEKHRKAVEKHLRECLKGDRARIKVGKISQFGMLEMTRQRVGPGLKRMLFSQCPTCRGTGMVRSSSSQGLAVLRRLRATLRRKNVDGVEVTVHPDVADYLLNRKRGALHRLEQETGRFVRIVAEPSFPGEGVHFQALSRKEEPLPGRGGSRNGTGPAPQGSKAPAKSHGKSNPRSGAPAPPSSSSSSSSSSSKSGSRQGSKGGGGSKRGSGRSQGSRRQRSSPGQGG
ncbi:MAG TPA: ribonuclease E/G, partial [Planctomycetes bacterium]|nr:ribonuclease E/G [Planctomycetota bacterium]